MPKIFFPNLYWLTYRSARSAFTVQPEIFTRVTAKAGTPWFRFVYYRDGMPQVENAGRTQFRPLSEDLNNRWTGSDPKGEGRQGLYFSTDFPRTGDPFPEATYYGQQGQSPAGKVAYYRYFPGSNPPIEPQLQVTDATNMRSMFLFSLESEQRGIDLRLQPFGQKLNPILTAIHEQMMADPGYEPLRKELAAAKIDIDNIESMYTHSENAEFPRAIGNAALDLDGADHLMVTSVRDGKSTNIVARTPVRASGEPFALKYLRPEGRATFFVKSADRVGEAVYTISDMEYNIHFESTTSPPPELPSVDVVKEHLVEVQQTAVDKLSEQVRQELEIRPATNAMDTVVDRIGEVQKNLNAEDHSGTIDAVKDLKVSLDAAVQDPPTVGEFQAALELSSGVADSVSKMAEAVQVANERVDGRDPDPDLTDLNDDPDPSFLEPDLPEPPPGEH